MRCSRTHHIYVSTPHRLSTLNMLCLSVCACCLPSIIFYCICGTAYLFIKCVQWIFHVSFSYFHFSFANAFFTVNSIFRLQLVVVLACYLYFFIYFFFIVFIAIRSPNAYSVLCCAIFCMFIVSSYIIVVYCWLTIKLHLRSAAMHIWLWQWLSDNGSSMSYNLWLLWLVCKVCFIYHLYGVYTDLRFCLIVCALWTVLNEKVGILLSIKYG